MTTWRFPNLPEDISTKLLVQKLNDRLSLLSQVLLRPEPWYDLRYATAVTVNVEQKVLAKARITATNGVGFTIGNPVGSQLGTLLVVEVYNNSGGALGTITWGPAYALTQAFTPPANGQRSSITFSCESAGTVTPSYVELCRSEVGTGGGGGGEANTASNVGTAGTGPFDAKVGVDLQFRKLNPASAKVTVALDAPNKKIDVDVVTGTTGASVCVGNDARLSDARTPLAHKTSHQAGGSDEISVAGLLGVLTNPQPPIIGAGAAQAVAGNDARLTDSRAPNGPAGGVLAGTYPNPSFALDMATQAELDAAVAAHLAAADPHPQYALDTDLAVYATVASLAGYQPKADTRFDTLGSDRIGTSDYIEERAGFSAITDTRAGIR